MINKNKRNIRKIIPKGLKNSRHNLPKSWKELDWPVLISSGSALIHHNHNGSDSHELCGPVAFCCTHAVDLFRALFPGGHLSKADWGAISAEQIISWIDAGMQVVYFVYCDHDISGDLAAACLVGKQARQTLLRQEELTPMSYCPGLIEEIAEGRFHEHGLRGLDFPDYSLI